MRQCHGNACQLLICRMFRSLRESHSYQLTHVEMTVLHRNAWISMFQILTHATSSINCEGGQSIPSRFDHSETACVLFNSLSGNGAPEEVSALGTADKNAIGAREERCIHCEGKRFKRDEHFAGVDRILIEVPPQSLGAQFVVFLQLCIRLFSFRIRMVEFLHLARDAFTLILTQKLMAAIQAFVELPSSLPTILFEMNRLTFLALFLGILNLGKGIALRLAQKAAI